MSIWLVVGWFIILSLVSFIVGFMFGFKKARKLQKEQEKQALIEHVERNSKGGSWTIAT